MKKNFILPLLTFAVSMFFYLSNFCWEKIREAKETASIKGQDVLKIMRDAYEVFIFDSEQAAYNPLLYIFPALLVVISILLGVLLFRFVTNKRPSTSTTVSVSSAPTSTPRVFLRACS